MKADVFLGLGSNLGDRLGNLERAVRELGRAMDVVRVSSVVETAAVDMDEGTPDFLNVVVEARSDLDPEELLERCMALEAGSGRVRGQGLESRPLDIDVLFYGDRIVRSSSLTIPHPRWSERSFVLRPLLDLAPELRDPVSGKRVTDVCDERRSLLGEAEVVVPVDSTERWIRPSG